MKAIGTGFSITGIGLVYHGMRHNERDTLAAGVFWFLVGLTVIIMGAY